MKEIKEMTQDEIRQLEGTIKRTMALKSIKVGEIVTQEQFDAIRFYLGESIDLFPEPRVLKIHFDKLGQPHTLDDDIIESVKVIK